MLFPISYRIYWREIILHNIQSVHRTIYLHPLPLPLLLLAVIYTQLYKEGGINHIALLYVHINILVLFLRNLFCNSCPCELKHDLKSNPLFYFILLLKEFKMKLKYFKIDLNKMWDQGKKTGKDWFTKQDVIKRIGAFGLMKVHNYI